MRSDIEISVQSLTAEIIAGRLCRSVVFTFTSGALSIVYICLKEAIIINESYRLISRRWGKNQLCKEKKTTEEETVQLISLSPLWLQQLPIQAKEDSQLKSFISE